MFAVILPTLVLAPLLTWTPHGGQYLPPAPDHSMDPTLAKIVIQPGLGPELSFNATSWEWWFDFNAEPLLDLRRRLPVRAQTAGSHAWRALSTTDRESRVLPALVDALRQKAPTTGGIRRHFNNRDVRAAERRYEYPEKFRRGIDLYNLHRALASGRFENDGLVIVRERPAPTVWR